MLAVRPEQRSAQKSMLRASNASHAVGHHKSSAGKPGLENGRLSLTSIHLVVPKKCAAASVIIIFPMGKDEGRADWRWHRTVCPSNGSPNDFVEQQIVCGVLPGKVHFP